MPASVTSTCTSATVSVPKTASTADTDSDVSGLPGGTDATGLTATDATADTQTETSATDTGMDTAGLPGVTDATADTETDETTSETDTDSSVESWPQYGQFYWDATAHGGAGGWMATTTPGESDGGARLAASGAVELSTDTPFSVPYFATLGFAVHAT